MVLCGHRRRPAYGTGCLTAHSNKASRAHLIRERALQRVWRVLLLGVALMVARVGVTARAAGDG